MTVTADLDRSPAIQVVIGVDTQQDEHVAVAIDRQGIRLGECRAPANTHGYSELERWSRDKGEIDAFGIEGTNYPERQAPHRALLEAKGVIDQPTGT